MEFRGQCVELANNPFEFQDNISVLFLDLLVSVFMVSVRMSQSFDLRSVSIV
jgi:hypothetical protein